MPPLKPKKPACKACGGTGKNSRGGTCVPCQVKIYKPLPKFPSPKKVRSIFDD